MTVQRFRRALRRPARTAAGTLGAFVYALRDY
jgi:hypothetical protein